MHILSIDVGVKNLALFIEYFNKDVVTSCKNVDEVCTTGKTTFLARLDLYKEGTCYCKIPDIVYKRLIDFLKKYDELFSACSCIIIEEQFYAFNKIAPQMACMIKMYFSVTHNEIPVVFVSPKIKTRALGADKSIKNKQLKKWVDKKIESILTNRSDKSLNFIKSNQSSDGHIFVNGESILCDVAGTNKKTNDYADAICQLQAFKYLFFVEKSLIF